MLTPEGRLKVFVREQLKAAGAYFFMPVPTGMGATTLDFLCCLRGRFLAIETKAPGKEPTARQLLTMKQIQAAGGVAFCCDSRETFIGQMQHYSFIESLGDGTRVARSSPPAATAPRSG